MWAPQLAAIGVTMACLWLFFWRKGKRGEGAPAVVRRTDGPGAARATDVRPNDPPDVRTPPAADRYVPPEVHRPADPVLFRVCAVACAGFLLATLVADVELWVASATAGAVTVGVFALRRRSELRLSLIPWRLLVMVPGMFLVVEAVNANGLHDLLASAIGQDGGIVGMFRAAAVGGGLSNVLNNLPVYLAGEGAVPPPTTTSCSPFWWAPTRAR